jgi:hypothetical protein
MSLPIQSYRLSEIVEPGMNLGGFAPSTDHFFPPAVRAMGQCFAFDCEALALAAQESVGLGWRDWMLRRATVGLWEENSQSKVYVGYTLHPKMVRVFYSSRQEFYPEKFSDIITATPAYIESGRDGFAVGHVRSLAYWEPTGPVVALWPQELEQFDGAKIPDTELVAFNHGNCCYHYVNRQDGGEMELPLDFLHSHL